ncbi:hypothetical protein [Corallococcus sp. Z5C101001]|uniref:hypothetical protein n=1 Tax=Corallococcus sp. Z5C101001 TaxID=2596829 RepID=UPI0011808523|nr:hypothetical protein [Corallococcus sp. Z5C101001]TSC33137.1 hypothetical protein FOF48_05745 [Corallococcus sp. Z5C101001]
MPTPSAPSASVADGGLFCELYWGTSLAEAWSYGPELGQVHAAPDETAPLPLYGFTLPEEPFLLAERTPKGWRIHVPPSARVEKRLKDDAFQPVAPDELTGAPGRASVELREGMTLRLMEGELRLLVQPSVVKERAGRFRVRDVAWLITVAILFLSAPIAFLAMGPDPARIAANNARALQAAHDKEEARRKAMGLDQPLRPLTEAEKTTQKQDGGTRVTVPASFGVR